MNPDEQLRLEALREAVLHAKSASLTAKEAVESAKLFYEFLKNK